MLIDGDLADNQIDIQVTGPLYRRRDALAVIRSLFAKVHERMPESVPVERVPLPDQPDVDVGFEYLRTLEEDEGPDHRFRPEGSRRKYSVAELLHGVRSDRIPSPAPTEPELAPGSDITINVHGSTNTNTVEGSTIKNTVEGADIENRSGIEAPSAAAPGDVTSQRADYAQLGGALGSAIGALCAVFYLLGQDNGWPLGVILAGAAAGVIIGPLIGLLLARRRD